MLTGYSKNKNKKKIILCIGFIFIAVVSGAIIFAFTRFGVKNYPNREEFRNAGGVILFEIPENASDCRYAVYRSVGSRACFYSFKLDKDSLEKYAADIAEQYHINESESDTKYGHGKWYGKKVRDCYDPEYTFDDFPIHLPFDSVTDEPIENYEVILYNPLGIGTRSCGVVIDWDISGVVVYEYKTIR